MSRSGYSDDCEDNTLGLYRRAVEAAINGKRGQALLIEMRDAMDAMPEKRLIAESLVTAHGEVCALGSVARARRLDVTDLDPDEADVVAKTFNIAESMAREIVYVNDEAGEYEETPGQRFTRVRAWLDEQIIKAPATPSDPKGTA